MMPNILCLLELHKWGFEHWGIRICQRCGKVDTHYANWGELRRKAEKEGGWILTTEKARQHWDDIERWQTLSERRQ